VVKETGRKAWESGDPPQRNLVAKEHENPIFHTLKATRPQQWNFGTSTGNTGPEAFCIGVLFCFLNTCIYSMRNLRNETKSKQETCFCFICTHTCSLKGFLQVQNTWVELPLGSDVNGTFHLQVHQSSASDRFWNISDFGFPG
jgi:hypothetical protein